MKWKDGHSGVSERASCYSWIFFFFECNYTNCSFEVDGTLIFFLLWKDPVEQKHHGNG